jgi:hypothetical protein
MSDCDVCLCGNSDVSIDFFFASVRKCRKPAKCAECGSPIVPGEFYQRAGGKCEGEMWTMKLCLLCEEVGHVFSCDGPRMYGNLWEDMRECVFPELKLSSKCFAKLSPAAKQFVLDKWKKWKF